MPGATSRSAAGPTLGRSANAEPSSPKPIAPRVRWAVIEVRARASGVWSRASGAWSRVPRSSCIFCASVDGCVGCAELCAERLARAVQA
jgi:hypothetical protein